MVGLWTHGNRGVYMMNYKKAKLTLLKRYPDSKVISSFDCGNSYIFSLKPKTWKDDDYVLDGLFKVSKTSYDITEYSPVMNPEEFKNAMSNKIE